MNLNRNIKIAIAGTGYVELSIATLLAQHHHYSLGAGFWLQAFLPVEGGIEEICRVVCKMRKVTKNN